MYQIKVYWLALLGPRSLVSLVDLDLVAPVQWQLHGSNEILLASLTRVTVSAEVQIWKLICLPPSLGSQPYLDKS